MVQSRGADPCATWTALLGRALRVLGGAYIIICLCGVGWFVALYFLPPRIAIVNRAAVPLRDVRLTGAGFLKRVGDLPPRTSVTVTVRPQGESGLEISFDTPAGTVRQDDLAYIESRWGYAVDLTVQPDFSVQARHHSGGF